MKKIILLFIATALTLGISAQKAVISFDVLNHDFGKIKEENGNATFVFVFTNKGETPLVVSNVRTSCGCTTPSWTKEPIEPGKKGSITVTYGAQGRPGQFNKTITVTSNATEENVVLTIKGEVIPKPSTNNSKFPVYIGSNIASSIKVVQFTNIKKGESQTRTINIKNTSNTEFKPVIDSLPSYFTYDAIPKILKPNEEGQITITLNSAKCPTWGPISKNIHLFSNSTEPFTESNKLVITGNVIEDFSKLTIDQKRNAPIIDFPQRNIDLGVIKVGMSKSTKIAINNKGTNPLVVRRIINPFESQIKVGTSKQSIGGNKSGYLTATINTKSLAQGKYDKTLTVISNDPDNSYATINVTFKVQD